jgi:beta-N-acetylhexosaminidase
MTPVAYGRTSFHRWQSILTFCLVAAQLLLPLTARGQATPTLTPTLTPTPTPASTPVASPASPLPQPAVSPTATAAEPTAEPAAAPAAAPDAGLSQGGVAPGDDGLALEVESILANMSVADRVGQLFIVNFEGNDLSAASDIALLIHAYRVGGVAISPQRHNFSNERGVDTPRQVAALTNQLQALAYGFVLSPERALDPVQIAPWPPQYEIMQPLSEQEPGNIPLLIAVEQAGDDLPNTALRRGFTPLPSQMAVGATWNTALAERVGEVVGRELHAVGVNMLLGPSLDVFDQTTPGPAASLGSSAFGGNSFWVSELGRAYISGVHIGGANRVATVARHFPGQGSSDRPPAEEVATIQKSLEEMRQTALPPFLAAAAGPSSVVAAEGDPGSTDVIMTSHMRYSAFQGGAAGRVTPISLAPELSTVFTQEGFDAWRAGGGVVMSNSLGVPAIRRFYGAAAQTSFNRRVALDAFLAGNDLLYLADFSLEEGNWQSESANIMAAIGFFQDRYEVDSDFAARVDASVRRILRLKLGLYREELLPAAGDTPARIPLPAILVGGDSLDVLAGDPRTAAEGVMNEVARQGITILFPDPALQTEPLPPTFRSDDRILVFSDSRLLRECSTCTAEAAIGPDELADIIKSSYGAEATGQIDPALITSLTFAELTVFLDNRAAQTTTTGSAAPGVAVTGAITSETVVSGAPPATGTLADGLAVSPTLDTAITTTTGQPPTAPDLEGAAPDGDALAQERLAHTETLIREADWILFAMLDIAPERYPASNAVPRFLSEFSDDLTEQRLVVFALNAPYFLDATEMSRLTTYFGVYGKTQPFLENAVRALFRAFSLVGAPPVAVPGTRFADLAERLAPDPARTLPLQAARDDETLLAANATAGTTVNANTAANAEDAAAIAAEAAVDVGATVRLTAGPIIDRNGHVVPDGTLVEFDLRYEGEEMSMALEPEPTRGGVATRDVVTDRAGTLRVAATAGAATSGEALLLVILPPPTPLPASGSAAEGEAAATAPVTALPERVNLATLVIALFTILITLSLFLIVQVRVLPRAVLVHNMLWAAIFGLLGYLLYGAGLFPGANWLRANVSVWGTTVVVFIPMLLPLLWLQLRGEE